MRTLNGYAEHKKLEGYKDCYLAKSIHGNGICLKARQTLTVGENDGPRNRWKYQGDVQQIVREEHVANIPLPHLIYGREFEAKGKRYCVVPREPMDNLMKFIDRSEPGEPPYVMLAVDQNDQVRVWQIRTIYQDEAITVDYGGAYWLNCWTRLSQQQQRKIREHHTHILFPPEWPHTLDGQITAKRERERERTGELEWAYAEASRNIYEH